ncbi:polynucleotide 5'-hydroxyl-kinase NOL9 [Pseudonaja textilis]|uniref:polynucleotide 5'-hydroxyl-kinase NOL9 n=1 Tax=Pseudonaja textilis TaxID=8673 RepID=UPI000EA85054|nr:polynucleotide 5'-hydroxyl-kinase NOL9 [Pseudonaja textilis]
MGRRRRRSAGLKRLHNGAPRQETPPPLELPAEPATYADAHDGRAVVLLPAKETLTFAGKCRLTCLYGSVRVLGFTIAPDQPPYDLYSPHTYCALTIEATNGLRDPEKSEKEMKVEARAVLRAHFVPQEARGQLLKNFGPGCSLLLLEQLDTPEAKFILSQPEFAKIFRPKKQRIPPFIPEDTVLASAGLVRLEPSSGLRISESMDSAIGELVRACQVEDEGCPVILVCGPKSTGKSTFNRYLMNLLLNHLPCLEYLECDLGQPEFNPPGCISLVNVREPLLGPPFAQQRPPRKMAFYGDISCERDTERYLDTLKYVFGGYARDVPLLINTMGWMKGAGLLLLIDVIRSLSPTHVVQLSAKDLEELPLLSADYIHTAAGLHTRGKPSLKRKHPGGSWQGTHAPQPSHQLLCVQANFPGAGLPGIGRTHSSTLRNLTMVGYLSQLQPPGLEPVVPLASLVPYQVPFNAVALKVIHVDVAPTYVLCSLNASWVGLCHLPDRLPCNSEGPVVVLSQTPLCDCLGFGIVRGVDMTKKLYYILTPLAPESLRHVNCLLIGDVAVPNCIFLNQAKTDGETPYVTSDYNYTVSGAGKLKVKRYLQRREHRCP